MTQDEAKHLVAQRAATLVDNGMAVGLGTGTTASLFIKALGERASTERLQLRCVASSEASHALAQSVGLDVTTLNDLPSLDLYIDGADEIGPSLSLIKGGGGALLREKIVASASNRFVVVADSTKVVKQLGKFPLPVEVIKMALPLVERKLTELDLHPELRTRTDGSPYLTDENNYILDCTCGVIDNPVQTAADIRAITGVVEHGLFLGMASLALIAGDDGVTELRP